MEERLKISLIILLIFLASFYCVIQPRLNYQLPLHSDEYDNLMFAKQAISNASISHSNPYMSPYKGENKDREKSFDLEFGYQAMLAYFLLATSLDILFFVAIFPAVIAFLSCLLLFLFFYKSTGRFSYGLATSLFFLLFPSNPSSLGYQLLVASNAGFMLLISLFYFSSFGLEKKMLKTLLLITFVSFLIYPPSPFAFFAIFFIYMLSEKEKLKAYWKKFLLFFLFLSASAIVLGLLMLSRFKDVSLLFQQHGIILIVAVVQAAFKFLINADLSLNLNLKLLDFVPLPLLILSIIGTAIFSFSLSGKKPMQLHNSAKLPITATIVFSASALSSKFFGFSFLPYSRAFNLLVIFLLVLSSIAIIFILELLSKKFLKEKTGLWRALPFSVFLILSFYLLSFLPFSMNNQYYHTLENEDLEAVIWLSENINKDSVILAPPHISKGIAFFSGSYVACTPSTKTGCSPLPLSANYFFFFTADCTEKKKIIDFFEADYVLVREEKISFNNGTLFFTKQNCPYLEEIFNKGNITIYKTKWVG